MTITYGIDYSWARPNPQDIKDSGFTTVFRYVTRDRTGKALTIKEREALHAAGLDIVLNFEDNAQRPLGGYRDGLADAKFCNEFADAHGAPNSAAIYYSIDSDLSYTQVKDYFTGIKDYANGRPVGAYGGGRVLNGLLQTGHITYLWQTNATAWSHGEPANPRHVLQLYGHPPKGNYPKLHQEPATSYDVNIIEKTNIGQWPSKPFQEDELSWSQWNPLERIDLVNQVAEEVSKRLTGGVNIVTGKVFNPTLNDYTVLIVTAVTNALTEAITNIPGSTAVDTDKVAKAVAADLAARLAE